MLSPSNFSFVGNRSTHYSNSTENYVKKIVRNSKLNVEEMMSIFELMNNIPLKNREAFFNKVDDEIDKGSSVSLNLFRSIEQSCITISTPLPAQVESANVFYKCRAVFEQQMRIVCDEVSKTEPENNSVQLNKAKERKERHQKKISKIPKDSSFPIEESEHKTTSIEETLPSCSIQPKKPAKKVKSGKAPRKVTGKTKNRKKKHAAAPVEEKPQIEPTVKKEKKTLSSKLNLLLLMLEKCFMTS